jgi:hypothetical protein
LGQTASTANGKGLQAAVHAVVVEQADPVALAAAADAVPAKLKSNGFAVAAIWAVPYSFFNLRITS